ASPAPWGRQGGDAPGGSDLGRGPGDGPAAGGGYGAPYQVGYDGTTGARLLATPDGQPLGALGLRLLARVVDYLIVSTVVAVAAWQPLSRVAAVFQTSLEQVVAAASSGAAQPAQQLLQNPAVTSDLQTVTYISIAVSAVYTILFLRFLGATPGKLLCGLRVRSWDQPGPLSWGQSILRWVSRDLVSNIPFLGLFYWVLDSLWPLWDTRRQALHDKPGRTVVVRARR
ncbi:hypothetical protein GTR02_11810, partial [Kineococcus sp. R8]|uniref:RDD family protein n=1 Tax=Kineococcus siccus TaxID=2696567 RepID=UPI0014122759